MTPTKLLIGQGLVVFSIILGALWLATQMVASDLAYQARLTVLAGLLVGACISTDVDQMTRDTAIVECEVKHALESAMSNETCLRRRVEAALKADYDYFVIEDTSSGYTSTLLTPVCPSTTTGSVHCTPHNVRMRGRFRRPPSDCIRLDSYTLCA